MPEPTWQELYKAALLELNPEKLNERIEAARRRDYAARHGFTVVQSYADAAKSGVVLRHRHGLRSLIRDVVGDQLSTRLSWCTTSVVGVAFKIVMKQPIMSSSAPESKERRQPPQVACGLSHTGDLLTECSASTHHQRHEEAIIGQLHGSTVRS